MKNDYSIIEKLNLLMGKYQAHEEPTFLSIIDRDYYEVYMSALIGYALSNDIELVKSLIERFFPNTYDSLDFDLSQIKVELEKSMDGRRADIVLKIIDSDKINDPIYTITIENKTNTGEHDGQTKDYQKWIKQNYKKSMNAFFYLVPDYNNSKPKSKVFNRIKYSEFNNLITNEDDYIISDLKNHIKKRMEVNMSIQPEEYQVICNYYKYSQILDQLAYKVKKTKEDLIRCFIESLKAKGFVIVSENNKSQETDLIIENCGARSSLGTSSYRLYKSAWWKEKTFYLYLEIKFSDKGSGPFDFISFQQTIYNYKKNNYIVLDYFDTHKDNSCFEKEKNCYVFKKELFNAGTNDWYTDEWKNAFINKAVDFFINCITECDLIASDLRQLYETSQQGN